MLRCTALHSAALLCIASTMLYSTVLDAPHGGKPRQFNTANTLRECCDNTVLYAHWRPIATARPVLFCAALRCSVVPNCISTHSLLTRTGESRLRTMWQTAAPTTPMLLLMAALAFIMLCRTIQYSSMLAMRRCGHDSNGYGTTLYCDLL